MYQPCWENTALTVLVYAWGDLLSKKLIKMKKPLKEHYQMPTDYGDTLAIYNYLEDLEKYVEELEQALRIHDVVGRSELFCECGDCQRNIVSGLFCTKCNKKYKR